MFELSIWKDIAISVLGGVVVMLYCVSIRNVVNGVSNWIMGKFSKNKKDIIEDEDVLVSEKDLDEYMKADVHCYFATGAFLGAMSVLWAAFCQRRFGYV